MQLHPQAELLINLTKEIGLPEIPTLSPTEARAMYDMRAAGLDSPSAIGEVRDQVIPGPGGDLPVRIYRPLNPAEDTPGLLFFHGGGWVIGTVETHDLVCRALCEATDATVISVEYRLAPEHPFPAAADDCVAATEWVAAHGASIGVDGTRLAVCGDSAGGNLSAVVAQDLVDHGYIKAQALVYPAVDASTSYDSHVRNGEGLLLTAAAMAYFFDHYVPDDVPRTNPRVSPLLGALEGQPPAIVLTAEYDPLVDEGVAYAEALTAAGVEVEYDMYNGQVHTFFTQVGFMDASLNSVGRIASFLTARW